MQGICLWHTLLLGLLSLLHTGSGSDPTEENDSSSLIRIINPSLEQSNENLIAESVNKFGYNLLMQMMKDNTNENIIISPSGVAGLLAMTLLGSVGRSNNEIADALGFSHDIRSNRKKHEEFGNLLRSLNGNETSKTMYADAVLVDTHSSLRKAYRVYLNRVYDGEAISIDFKDRNAAKMSINKWVSDHTNKKIEDFLKQPLPADTKVVLLSALYFSGQWQIPFVPEYTKQMPFKTPNDEKMTNLMYNQGEFKYIYSIENDLQMIALPYNDSLTTLYALKPRLPKEKTLKQLLSDLDSEKIDKIIDQLTLQQAIVRFPKIDIKSTTNLEDALQLMGIQTMFQPKQANFALMINSDEDVNVNKTKDEVFESLIIFNDSDGDVNVNKTKDEALESLIIFDDSDEDKLMKTILSLPNPGVHVDSIIHDVKMSINEYGTEAVAATSAIIAKSVEQFYANSPFYMFIRNEKTKLITFSAVINDPTS